MRLVSKRRGRPRLADPASASLELRVTAGQRQELEQIARENHTTVSGMIRDAVLTYCAELDERAARSRRPRRQ